MFHVPEQYRITDGQMASDKSYGNNGAFRIPVSGFKFLNMFIIASDGMDWEHVSIHLSDGIMGSTPTWDDMCKIKDMFWDEEDCVVQYHPPKSKYVNVHKHTLHLWRPMNRVIPLPPSKLI